MTGYTISRNGAVTAPHYLAAQAGQAVLREGGNAIEAAIAAGAVLTVVYPHMNALGGDAFFVIADQGGQVHALDGAGPAGEHYSIEMYQKQGHGAIPKRGPLAANTVAGLVSAWDKAYALSRDTWGGRFSWQRLLQPAHDLARDGFALSEGQPASIRGNEQSLRQQQRFVDTFCPNGTIPVAGQHFCQPDLARSFATLMDEGAESFYRGSLARRIIDGLAAQGCRLTLDDLARYEARFVRHIAIPYHKGVIVNMPPPSVGLISAIILGLIARFDISGIGPASAEFIHLHAEATKLAYTVRDRYLSDPDFVDVPVDRLLSEGYLDRLAELVDVHHAQPMGRGAAPGDTVWFGTMDAQGRGVSAIQSLCWEYGSGMVAGDTGILWHNRGHGFSLTPGHVNAIAPGKRPMHTLNAPLYLEDGKPRVVFGTMGGEGQPQTVAMLATRTLDYNLPLTEVLDSPRWVYGRAWGDQSVTSLKLEGRVDKEAAQRLAAMGHEVEWLPDYSVYAGHAGVIRLREDGQMEAASDPRSDGDALGG